jgi:hypothetical protein
VPGAEVFAASGEITQPRAPASSTSQDHADQRADRRILRPLAHLDEVDVEHHHHEQEQHRDRADIDDDQDHRQELGPEQDEQPGGVEERQDQEQHRMHRIARCNHHEGGRTATRRRDRKRALQNCHDRFPPTC